MKRGETFQEEPKAEPARGGARVIREIEEAREGHKRVVLSAQEKKRRRDEDARRYVETAVKASGGTEAVRELIDRKIGDADRRIAELTQFDRALQEERDFLVAQREAIKTIPDVGRSRKQATVLQPEIAVQPKPLAGSREPGIFDRLKSGWNSLKGRFFGGPATREPVAATEVSTLSAYDRTWTEERKARRPLDREREVGSIKERAVDTLRDQLYRDERRISEVTSILSRRRKEPLPSNVRARFVAEVQGLKASMMESERLLRIAEATSAKKILRQTQEISRKKAA